MTKKQEGFKKHVRRAKSRSKKLIDDNKEDASKVLEEMDDNSVVSSDIKNNTVKTTKKVCHQQKCCGKRYGLVVVLLIVALCVFIHYRVVTKNITSVDEFFGGGLMGVEEIDATDPAQFGYAVGYMFGQQVKQGMVNIPEDVVIDQKALVRAISDVVLDRDGVLSDEDVQNILTKRTEMEQKKFEESSLKNIEQGKVFLENYIKKEAVQKMENGVLYTVIANGSGVLLGTENVGMVRYRGVLVDGTEFDSSGDESVPFATENVIPGFGAALAKMRVGDKWEIVIPSEQAYGTYGSPGAIGPNETLIFTVELVSIQNAE